MMGFLQGIARAIRTADEFSQTDSSMEPFEWKMNFLELLARGVRTACQSVQTADEQLVDGYPCKDG